MKLKYIIAAFAATVTLAAGCQKEAERYLSEVQVSSSYVAIDQNGGSTDITVTATASWSISGAPDWLTVSPASGSSGQSKVSFSAESTLDGRTTEVLLTCDGATQHINVIQGLAVVSKATCAEVVAGPDSKTYLVSGVCTAITNTQYGNFYINDGTADLYIYGTVNSSGNYDWASFDIEVGDEVTVQGPKTTYGGTPELIDATFISVSKSLMKVEEVSESSLTSDGGDFTVTLSNKGEGVYVEIPEDAQEWLSIKSLAANVVTFAAAPNTAGPRSTTLVFKTYKSGKEYTAETSITQAGLSGTIDVPFTVSEAIAFCNTLSGPTADNYYVKGIVTKVLYEYSANYGTATFWISDDGDDFVTEDKKGTDDPGHDFECYSIYWLGNQSWTDGEAQIEPGDEVVVCGQFTIYNGVGETNSKNAYVYAVNGLTEPAMGSGTEAYPFTVAGAIKAVNSGFMNFNNDYFVSGIVTKVLYSFSADYGTGTFWISDDGDDSVTENKKGTDDPGHDFECYSVYWNDNQPWAEGDDQIASGDRVTIAGKLTLYNGVAETSSKKAYVFSHDPLDL